MGLFDRPEVVILKESSDAKKYLEKLEDLYKSISDNTELAQRVEKEIAITKAGIIGEEQIMFELKNSGMDLFVLHDIYIEDDDGNGAQIDYFIVTPYVNVFVECKNLFGNIEINNKGDFVRTIQLGKRFYKEGIYSPITQNERHMQIYKNICRSKKGRLMGAVFNSVFEQYNKSLVVMANPKTVVNDKYAKAEVKRQVIRADQLIATLKGMKSDAKSNKKQMRDLAERMLAMNIEERNDYFAKFEDLKKEYDESNDKKVAEAKWASDEGKVIETSVTADITSEKEIGLDENLICPKCGSKLVLRTAQKGDNAGKQFYGCGAFPKCRYTKNLAE